MAIKDLSGTPCVHQPPSNDVSADALRRALFVEQSYRWCRYEGTPDQIVAAGLFRLDEMPGQPGRPKTACRYAPSGDLTRSRWVSELPGGRTIKRYTKKVFVAYIALSQLERDAQEQELEKEQQEYAQQAEADAGLSAMLIELMIEEARRELALTDEQLVAKSRAKLNAKLLEHEEDLRTLGKLVKPKASYLKLVHSAGRVES